MIKKTKKISSTPYKTFDPDNTKSVVKALADHSAFFDGENVIQHARADLGLSDVVPNQSVRPGFRRSYYENFRPSEALPKKFEDIIFSVQAIYRSVGVIKTSIDLMADFASEGLRFEHSSRTQQQWYNAWSTRINLQNFVHNFMLNLLRDGNVIIRRKTAIITKKQNSRFMRGQAKPDIKIEKDKKLVSKREIQWEYLFIYPAVIKVIGGAAGSFMNQTILAIKIPTALISMVKKSKHSKDEVEKAIVKELPTDVLNAIEKGEKEVLLDMTKIHVSY